jgi:hypothetical protein
MSDNKNQLRRVVQPWEEPAQPNEKKIRTRNPMRGRSAERACRTRSSCACTTDRTVPDCASRSILGLRTSDCP